MAAPALVPEVLKSYGAAARAVMATYLPAREPRRYLYDLVADYPRRGGRGFRPSLCIATARAFGAPLEDAVHSAASIEMLHNAMLIHDDIEDESDLRRGEPTLHAREGLALALNAGDLLALLGLRPLVENRRRLGARLAIRVVEETERMAVESAEGQALELGWRRDNTRGVTEADYLAMVLKKTCWLGMIHPARVGALIGTDDTADLDGFVRFGFFLGAAFQVQDDLLNLTGDATAYGKELGGDIHEGKRTLMLISLLERCDEGERARVYAMLGAARGRRAAEDILFTRALMDRYGCVDDARRVASGLAGAAQHEFERAFRGLRASRDLDFIASLPAWVIERA
jgi:geranylgeranyl diphosphate synthase type II